MTQSPRRQSKTKKHHGQTSAEAGRTKDHDVIRKWVEDRDGHPSVVQDTEILRIDFDEPGGNDDALDRIAWDDFFKIFDDRDLTFLYQESTADAKQSRFNKFVRGDDDD